MIKIVADSSADLTSIKHLPFAFAPLKISTAEHEFVDNGKLDIFNMATTLKSYKGKSHTSCPSIGDWLQAFGDAEKIICITITATLSGSYNSAMNAKAEYEAANPGRRVFVINSLSTGPEMALIVEKIEELAMLGKTYDEICDEIMEYTKKTGLLFVLESLRNLANNGRVSPIVAKMAGLLGIRLVGRASDKGDLEPLDKCRGEKRAIDSVVSNLKAMGLKSGKVRICHCFNEGAANALRDAILLEFGSVTVEIDRCLGLCSFYAEMGGMLIGFEKF